MPIPVKALTYCAGTAFAMLNQLYYKISNYVWQNKTLQLLRQNSKLNHRQYKYHIEIKNKHIEIEIYLV